MPREDIPEELVEIAGRALAERAGDEDAYDDGLDWALEWRDDARAVLSSVWEQISEAQESSDAR